MAIFPDKLKSVYLQCGGRLETVSLQQARQYPNFIRLWDADSSRFGDIYHKSEYLAAAERAEAGTIILIRYDHQIGSVLRAVTLRELNVDGVRGRYDATSPFEYGGPIVSSTEVGKRQTLIDNAQLAYLNFCSNAGIVAEFVRFNPVLINHAGWEKHYSLRESCQNIVIDLRPPLEQIIANYSASQRRNMRIAEREGILVRQPDFDPGAATEFKDSYFRTMDRRGAGKSYYFPENYFVALCKLAPKYLNYYHAASASGKTLASLVTLTSEKIAHSHLLCTTEIGLKTKATSLLYHLANVDLRSKNIEVFHLGGAAPSQTGVLEFKQRFSDYRRSYVVGSLVIDRQVYERLCRAQNVDSTDRDFFPAYRNYSSHSAN